MTMPRTYAAKRLLEHGPLSMAQFKEITGWKPRQARRAMQNLVDAGVVHKWSPPRLRHATSLYALASSNIVAGCTNTTQQKHAQHTSDTGRFARG